MRQIDSYTESQLVALTDAELERVIAVQCAVEGVAMLPEKPIAPEPFVVKPDVEVFEVCGVSYMNKADADEVADLVNSKQRAAFGYDRQYRQFFKEPTYDGEHMVSRKGYCSSALLDQHSVEIAKAAEAKKAYDAASKEYNSVADVRESIAGRIMEKVYEARERARQRDDFRARFKQYIELADGNTAMALQFFEKAYGTAFVKFPELREEFAPPTVEVAEARAA